MESKFVIEILDVSLSIYKQLTEFYYIRGVMHTKNSNQNKRKLIKEAYIIIGLASILSIGLLLYAACLFLGRCYLQYDSTLAEIGVCLDTDYQPVINVPISTEQLFLCGKVVGTTPHREVIDLLYEGEWIYSIVVEQRPGTFFQPIPVNRIQRPGTYRIEIWYAKRLLATTEFSVTLP